MEPKGKDLILPVPGGGAKDNLGLRFPGEGYLLIPLGKVKGAYEPGPP